ncbi:hypothetical protein PVAP13_5NG239162, partial [Panicum virgatum]
VWHRLGITVSNGTHQKPWTLGCELQLPQSVHMDAMMLMLWQIWKARNTLMLDRADSLPMDILRRMIKDMEFWRCHYKKLGFHFDRWHSFFPFLSLAFLSPRLLA